MKPLPAKKTVDNATKKFHALSLWRNKSNFFLDDIFYAIIYPNREIVDYCYRHVIGNC